jgi:hypothetical protein
VTWAVEQIVRFLHQQQSLALDMAKVVVPGTKVHTDLMARSGLVGRVTEFDPSPIP